MNSLPALCDRVKFHCAMFTESGRRLADLGHDPGHECPKCGRYDDATHEKVVITHYGHTHVCLICEVCWWH